MSALTRFVTNTFTDISHKRQSKRLVHDESLHNESNGSSLDTNPNFNFFDPNEHFSGREGKNERSQWEGPSTQSTNILKKSPEAPTVQTNTITKQGITNSESTTSITEVAAGKLVPLKNMVKKLTPFNNNNKEIKDKNIEDSSKVSSTEKTEEEMKKGDKKGVWKIKDQMDRRKGGDRQMLIDLDGDSF